MDLDSGEFCCWRCASPESGPPTSTKAFFRKLCKCNSSHRIRIDSRRFIVSNRHLTCCGDIVANLYPLSLHYGRHDSSAIAIDIDHAVALFSITNKDLVYD